MAEKKSTIKKLLAVIQGDNDEVKALKLQKRIIAALKVEVAKMESEVLGGEMLLEKANTDYEAALLNNGELNFDPDTYISNLATAKNQVIQAETKIEEYLATLNILKEALQSVED